MLPGLAEIDVSFSSSSSSSHGMKGAEVDALKAAENVVQLFEEAAQKNVVSDENKDEDSDDSLSLSSIDSLLSSRSDSESLSLVLEGDNRGHHHKALRGIERLEKKLELRRRKLHQLCVAEPKGCIHVLKANEEAVRKLEMKQFLDDEQAQKKHVHGRQSAPSPKEGEHARQHPATPHSFLQTWWWLLFEAHLVIPASIKLLVVCCCHLFVHGTLETACKMVYQSFFLKLMSQQVFCICQVILGLLCLRANGYLWYFLDKDAYNVVKFDMHNRVRLQRWDAKLLAYFKTTIFGSAANLVGFYLVYVGLNQLILMPFNNWMKELDTWYLATKESLLEEHDLDKETLKFYSWEGTSPGYSEKEDKTCKLLKQYISPGRLQWLFEYVCTDPFQDLKSFEVMYQGVGMLAITLIAASLGVNILQICDEE
ncbi:MAG: hypothetical protein SGARI_001181 [Bacillariaceae sp.]